MIRFIGRAAGAALVAALAASPAFAQSWKQIAKGAPGELWVDVASIQRANGEAVFTYRVDLAKPEKVFGTGAPYRSTVTRAMVRCSARTIATGLTIAYTGPRATGKLVDRFPPTPDQARFQPIERQTSDENLWRYICQVASVTPSK